MDMLKDSIISMDAAAKLRVLDVAELVAGSMQTPAPDSQAAGAG